LVTPSNKLALVDTNVCIEREDTHIVASNVRRLFERLARLQIPYVVHPQTFNESRSNPNHEQKYFFISKLCCYPLLRSPPNPDDDNTFLNIVGRPSEGSEHFDNERVDNALLYAVYKGAVSCLITEDKVQKKSIHAKAKKLKIQKKVLTVDRALEIFDERPRFDNISFTWVEALVDHIRDKVLGATVELIGRGKELGQLRSLVDDQDVQAVVISGLPGVGKTRLALHASEHRQDDVIAIAPPHPRSAEELRQCLPQTACKETLVIIDNADSMTTEALLRELPWCVGMKLVITTNAADFVCPRDRNDHRIVRMALFPLTHQQSEELLEAAGAKLGYNLESWWIPMVGGIPGVLLEAAVAQAQSRLKKEAPAVIRDEERRCIKWARETLGDETLAEIQLLSILENVGIEVRVSPDEVGVAIPSEIEVICDVFSNEIEGSAIVEDLERLERAGIIQRKGPYVRVVSPLLANGLARDLMQSHSYDFVTLFTKLGANGQKRLLMRLQPIKDRKANTFWNYLFTKGPFADFDTALANSNSFYTVARANPKRVSELIDLGLKNKTIYERSAISDAHKITLVQALYVLLFDNKTYEKAANNLALNNLALLAEVEAEHDNTNATRYFCSYFYPRHPQVQSTFKKRTRQLQGIIFGQNKSTKIRELGITAISSSLEQRSLPIFLQPSDAAEPIKPPSPGIVAELLDYMDGLIRLLMKAKSEEPTVARHALAVFPKANVDHLETLLRLPSPENRIANVIERLRMLTDWAIAHEPLSVSDLDERLERCSYLLKESVTKRGSVTEVDLEGSSGFSGSSKDELKATVSEIKESTQILMQYVYAVEELIQKLDKADFTIRLKKWVGRDWSPEERVQLCSPETEHIYEKPRSLARGVLYTPELLNDELMAWLCKADAKRSNAFLRALGALDQQLQFVNTIIPYGNGNKGVENFVSYFMGLNEIKPDYVSIKLDELVENEQVPGDAVAKATGCIRFCLSGYERVLKLLREGKATPERVLQAINSLSWINGLSEDECAHILKLASTANFENAALIIYYLHAWDHERALGPKLTALAWSCLEAMPLIARTNQNIGMLVIDELASNLAKVDPKHGLALLESILVRHEDVSCDEWLGTASRWDPLSLTGSHKFWNALWEPDPEGVLRFVLQIALDHPEVEWRVTDGLRNVTGQSAGAQLLLTIALENERRAELICSFITAHNRDFCQIAYKIIEFYPDNEEIQKALINSFLGEEAALLDESLEKIVKMIEKIKTTQDEGGASPAIKSWLEKLSQRLKHKQEFLESRSHKYPGALIYQDSA
jgi:hypothetical protein